MRSLLLDGLDSYVESHTRARPALLDELRDATHKHTTAPQMLVGRTEGTFLKLLVASCSVRRVIEVGTFTGYSALCMAEALPNDGELFTFDINPETTKLAQGFFDRSPHGKKIHTRLGDAAETLSQLSGTFDFAFIDADKGGYQSYYEAILPRLRQGALIVADNTLWSGAVLNPKTSDDHAIVNFNRHVNADPRVENVLLSVRDGMMLARKL